MAWNFDDFLRRLEAIKGMGSIDELIDQVPGLGSILRDVEFNLADLEPIERILRAMTLEERLDPGLLDGDAGIPRRSRIAEASGTSLDAVESLIWQFRQLCEMLEAMSPEEVTQELLDTMQPNLADWQTSPDAWKDAAPEEELESLRYLPASHEVDDEDDDDDDEEDALTRARREREALNARLDQILRKISSEGMELLTSAERAYLDEAIRRLRATSNP